MTKKYKCKDCEFEVELHSDEKLPAPKKCPGCGGTNIQEK